MENYSHYEDVFIDSGDIEFLLIDELDSLEINRILSAYEMAEMICQSKQTPFGMNSFNHATRVCYILIYELSIFEPEMICAALLHDVFNLTNDITPEIIDFNFGAYTTYLIQCITESHTLCQKSENPDENKSLQSQVCNDDYLLILGAEHLDTIRCFGIDVTGNVLKYLEEISKNLIPLFDNSQNQDLIYLKTELLKHRNKILC